LQLIPTKELTLSSVSDYCRVFVSLNR